MAASKQFLDWLTKTIDNNCIETGLGTKPMDTRNTDSTAKFLVHVKFMLNGKMLTLHGLKFDNNIFSWQIVMRKVYISYAPISRTQEGVMQLPRTYQMNQTQSYFAAYISRLCEQVP